jgi:hypothetical protein
MQALLLCACKRQNAGMVDAAEPVPEYLRLLLDRYPDFSKDAVIIATIGSKINRYHGNSDHINVCVNQCRVAWEWLNSVQCLAAYDYGLGAISLCRNLFELVAGTIFLIDNPNNVQDFVDSGKVVAYEVTESMMNADPNYTSTLGVDPKKYLLAFKDKADYDNLKKRFGKEKWHGHKSIKTLANAVGMKVLYDGFYKETSAIVHGDAFATISYKNGAWGLEKDVRSWSSYCDAALDFSFTSVATLYHRAVHKLGLPFVPDVQAVKARLIEKGIINT